MRQAAIAVTFVVVFDAPPEGEWEGRDRAIFDLIWYHEMPASSHKIFEGTAHALECMLSHDASSLLRATDTVLWMKDNRHTDGRG